MHGLHSIIQHPDTPYKPHSDVRPYEDDEMSIAKDVIFGCHPIPENMKDTGIISNVKTLFGDAEFWSYLRMNHMELFNRLVHYIQKLPRRMSVKNMYASVILDPITLIRDYFPEAYFEICCERKDFISDNEIAIEVVEIYT